MARRDTYQRWTAAEIDYLRENYSEETALDIARALSRTPDSIWEKAGREGLRKHAKRRQRSEDGPWVCMSCGRAKNKSDFGNNREAAECRECSKKRRH